VVVLAEEARGYSHRWVVVDPEERDWVHALSLALP
jgi:hypothetical protein